MMIMTKLSPRSRRSKILLLQLFCLVCHLSAQTIFTEVRRMQLYDYMDNVPFWGVPADKELEPYVNENEPFYGKQAWIFDAINVSGAWKMGYTGYDIRVRINDVDWIANHTEWVDKKPYSRLINRNENAEKNYTCGDFRNKFEDGDEIENRHSGTLNAGAAVTSVLGADGTNSHCGSGIAPLTKLSFCRFDHNTTHPKVLMFNAISQEIGASKNSFDISMNGYAYEGCSAEPRGNIVGLYWNKHTENFPRRRLQNEQTEIRVCPFVKFYKDKNNPSSDPCKVCTQSDLDVVSGKSYHDNIFDTSSTTLLYSENLRGGVGDALHTIGDGVARVSDACATSVRAYCLRNFRKDEDLCTEWIDVINDGNICRFKSNVGKANAYSFEMGAKEGRLGRGVTFIFAAGDSYGNGDNVNFHAYAKSRFVMTVGAVKMTEIMNGNNTENTLEPIHATYSTTGSSIFVVAPGGDYDSSFQHVGAGQMWKNSLRNTCNNIGYGTSYAASVVGGVVALMLEANEYMFWRDIRAIIVKTSKPITILDSDGNNDDATFGINAAGVGYSDLYGFGLIDATAAVQEAKNWLDQEKTMPKELATEVTSGIVNLDIRDDPFSKTVSTIRIKNSDGLIESISVYLKLRYFDRGNLRITLTSPSGTTSLLSPGGRHEYGQLECGEWWEFLTLRSWGESPRGKWKLTISDTKPGSGLVTCIDRPTFSVPIEETRLNFTLTCQEYESEGYCLDGKMNENNFDLCDERFNKTLFDRKHGPCALTALSACCVCGGGMRPNDDEMMYNQLVEWKIKFGDGIPKSGTKRLSNYDPHLPEISTYDFIRCRSQDAYGRKVECCNGLENICDLRVNEVLFASLHDGMTEFEEGNFVRINQQFEIERALEAGYRALKLDVCKCNGELEFCSAGQCNPIARRYITDVIMYFREFLERNPSEIAILFFEIRSDIDEYVNLSEFWIELIQVMRLAELVYTHDDPNGGTPWPTLRELINRNKRLIMFHHNGPNCTETPQDCPNALHYYEDWVSDNNDHVFMDPFEIENRTNSCEVNRSDIMEYTNTFVGLRNFVSPFDLKERDKVNVIRSAERLQEYYAAERYIEACEDIFGRKINFLTDDWWGVGDVLRMTQDYNTGRVLGENWVAPTNSPSEDPNDDESPTEYPTFFPTFGLATPAPTKSVQPSVTPSGSPSGPYDPCPEHKGDCNGCKEKIENCLWCKSTSTCYNREIFGNIFDLDDEILPCAGEDILDSFDYTCDARPILPSVFDDDLATSSDDDMINNNETSSEIKDTDEIEELEEIEETWSLTDAPTTVSPSYQPSLQPSETPTDVPVATPSKGFFQNIFGGGGSSGASSLSMHFVNIMACFTLSLLMHDV